MDIDLEKEPVLFPYQVKWLSDPYPVKIAEKSRQIGFTYATAAMAALEAASNKGRHTYYVGYNKAMASEFIADVAFWADVFQMAVKDITHDENVYVRGKKEHSTFIYKVEFASGYSVTALSSHPENIRSKRGNLIIDEAAFHKDLPGLMKAGLALTTWGGKVMVISTHDGDTNAFAQRIDDVRIGKEDGRLYKSTFMEAVNQGLYKRIAIKEGMSVHPDDEAAWVKAMYRRYGDDAEEELDVIPSRGGSGYIPVQAIERAMKKANVLVRLALENSFLDKPEYERELEIRRWYAVFVAPIIDKINPNLRTFLGGDFGRTIDKSAFAILVEMPNMDYDCPVIVELHNVPFESQWIVIESLFDQLNRLEQACFEARGNGEPLAERAASTYRNVMPVKTSESFYVSYMPEFKSAFEEAIIHIPNHTDVLQDVRSIDVVKGVPKIPDTKRRRGTDGLTRHGDAAMGLFFAWCATRQDSGPAIGSSVSVPVSAYNFSR